MPEAPTARLTVAETLERWPSASSAFARLAMACPGCAMAPFDTLGEAAAVYAIRVETLLAELQGSNVGAGEGRR